MWLPIMNPALSKLLLSPDYCRRGVCECDCQDMSNISNDTTSVTSGENTLHTTENAGVGVEGRVAQLINCRGGDIGYVHIYTRWGTKIEICGRMETILWQV